MQYPVNNIISIEREVAHREKTDWGYIIWYADGGTPDYIKDALPIPQPWTIKKKGLKKK